MKLICRQVIAELLGHGISYEKIDKYTTSARMQFSPQDVKAMLAALRFVFSNATKHDVAREVLLAELEQLGLPQDICKALCKTWHAAHPELRDVFRSRVMALPRVARAQWRVDYTLLSSEAAVIEQPSVRVRLALDKAPAGWEADSAVAATNAVTFEASADSFAVLLGELKQARAALQLLARQ
jgi:hypothetical protein